MVIQPGNYPRRENSVVLQWDYDMIRSGFGSENDIPPNALEMQKELFDLTEDNWLEINERLTPEKMIE